MNDNPSAFIDTNILIYLYDIRLPNKRKRAKQLLNHLIISESVAISAQVVQEFCNVAINKIEQLDTDGLKKTLSSVVIPLVKHVPSGEFYLRAIALRAQYQLNFYDAMIIQAALDLGCDVLYSEDLQDRQTFGNLKITNPFK